MLEISVQQLDEFLKNDQKIVLLDVRQEWEHQLTHLSNSILISLGELGSRVDEVIEISQATAAELIVVYCHHGVRSLRGAAILQKSGLRNVVSLAGGIDAWSREIDPQIPIY